MIHDFSEILERTPEKMIFGVQSPWQNSRNRRDYPVTTVVIEVLGYPVFTKNGYSGIGIQAQILLWNGNEAKGLTVWAPEDNIEYNFFYGAERALKRAVRKLDLTGEMKGAIWQAFQKVRGQQSALD